MLLRKLFISNTLIFIILLCFILDLENKQTIYHGYNYD
jgi:hypothetical protein